MGSLPPSNGFTHLLTVIDRFSRWPEAIPLSDTTSSSCAQALIFHWIARFGIPLDISSDRGPQFTSQLWTSISRLLGTQLHHTTSYHPQSNGLIERFHRHMKSALRACLSGPNWIQELPWVLLGIRTMPKEDLGRSSAEIVFGAPLTVPGDFIPSYVHTQSDITITRHLRQLHEQVRSLVPVPTSQHSAVSTSVPNNLQQAKFVFIHRDAHRTPLQRPYEGPFKVIQPGPKTLIVDIGGKNETISVDRLKPACLDLEQPAEVAEPRRHRGRPKKYQQSQTISGPPQPLYTRSGRQVKPPLQYISVLEGSGVADTQ